MRFNNSLGEQDTIAAFDRAMASVGERTPVVIDLTDTPSGGNSSVARAMISWFIDRPTFYQDCTNSQPKSGRLESGASGWSKSCRGPANITPTCRSFAWAGGPEAWERGSRSRLTRSALASKATGWQGSRVPFTDLTLPSSGLVVKLPVERLYTVDGRPREAFVRAGQERGWNVIRNALAGLAAVILAAPSFAATVVTADRMLDVRTGQYVANPAILIGDDGHIQQIGTLAAMQLPAGTKHIDLPGETLLPGLIDMHVHLTSLAEIGGYQGLKYTDNFWTAVGVANAKTTLNAGFTTVRNVGSSDFADVALQQAIDGGWIQGPRIVPATYAIGATGGHCDDTGLPPYYDKKADSVISGPEDAREKVRWLHKYGAEVIKICATGGVFSLGDSVGAQQLSLEEMKAIADEAHMLGLRSPRTRMATRASMTRSSPGSTRSSMPASPATRPSSSPSSMAPGSTWISTTTTISSRPEPRTAPSRRASTRRGDRPQAAPDLPARGSRRA